MDEDESEDEGLGEYDEDDGLEDEPARTITPDFHRDFCKWCRSQKTPQIGDTMPLQAWIDWLAPRKNLGRWQEIAGRQGIHNVPNNKKACISALLLTFYEVAGAAPPTTRAA
eukprot:5625416-Alexandrium_andersonii.AAC.1